MKPNIFTLLLLALALLSLISFVLMGVDKARARKRRWRIPEATLLLVDFLGGGLGGLLGMMIFRHKIRHPKFLICVPLSILLWGFLIYFLYSVFQGGPL